MEFSSSHGGHKFAYHIDVCAHQFAIMLQIDAFVSFHTITSTHSDIDGCVHQRYHN